MKSALLPHWSYGPLRKARNLLAALLFVTTPALAEGPGELPEIVALGDSLTQGYGLPPEQGLVPQLQDWLAAHGTPATVVNAGVSGDTSAGGLARLDWSITPQTDAMLVILGGNDMLRGIDPGVTRANLDAILKGVMDRKLPVLLVAMRAPGNFGPAYKAEFDAIYPDLAAKYHVPLADFFFTPLGGEDAAAVRPLLQGDGIHPNAAGVVKVVDWLGPQVQKLLQPVQQ